MQEDFFDAKVQLNDVFLETVDESASIFLNGVLFAPVYAIE